jgi:hypothetical protein
MEIPQYSSLYASGLRLLHEAARVTEDGMDVEPGQIAQAWSGEGFRHPYARLATVRELLVAAGRPPIKSFNELTREEVAALARLIGNMDVRMELRQLYAQHLTDWQKIQGGELSHPTWWRQKLAIDRSKK